MVEEMNIKLENLGPIKKANINFSKITVVGGHNATGKSTLSRFIYSFLKSNSYTRQEIALESIFDELKDLMRYIRSYLRKIGLTDSEVTLKFSTSRFRKKRFRDIDELIDEYEEMKLDFEDLDVDNDEIAVNDRFAALEYIIQIVHEDSINLYMLLMNHLLESEFSTTGHNFYSKITNSVSKNPFEFIIDFKNHENDLSNVFSNDGGIILNNVYYIDSISILDTFEGLRFSDRKEIDHIKSLKECLIKDKKDNVFDEKINCDIIDLEEDINKIVKGYFVYEKGEFNFVSSSNVKFHSYNTASGIKQLGIIQLLLSNRELKDNCVLIIDEPEVNLHPEWQMKLAEILVLISKKLNVSIYINTHSPLFIEAIYTFTNYYEIENKTKYHLAEPSDEEGFFNINEVGVENLSMLYDDLGKPYMAMDVLRIEKTLR